MQLALRFLWLTALIFAVPALAQQINQPPQLLFSTAAAYTPAWGTGQLDPISLTLESKQGGVAVCYQVADADAVFGNIETATVQLQGCASPGICQLIFPNDVASTVSNTAPGLYLINTDVLDVSSLLNCFSLAIQGTTAVIGTISITVNDNGFSGWCSAGDPTPCGKTATATVAFDAYTGTPDRIYLGGFDPR